jgi:DNA-binding NarL/FixJ family response regulator
VPAPPLRVFVIGEQPIFRMGLVATLTTHAGIHVVGESADGADAERWAPGLAVQVLLLVADGRPTRWLAARVEALRVVFATARIVVLADDLGADAQVQFKVAGAGGLVLKCASAPAILQATLTPGYGLAPVARATDRRGPGADLTDRERDVLHLMALGLSNADIASQRGVALPTVKFHIGNIMSKLHAGNRTAAVLAALRHQLVSLDVGPSEQSRLPADCLSG